MLDYQNGVKRLDYTFEPHHRQSQEHNPETFAAGAKAHWTSARCHRLLRPLSSKIALLRKERQTSLDLNEGGRGSWKTSSRSGTHTSGTSSQQLDSSVSTGKIQCTEWDCSPRPCKRIRRTYSSRTRRLGPEEKDDDNEDGARFSRPPKDAVIGLPPNFSIASANILLPRPPTTLAPGSRAQLEGRWRTFKSMARSSSGKLIDGIYKGLEALLLATASNSPCSASGSRSLFSTCLRQVPRYIAEEEVFARIDDPDNDLDISCAVYNDLETIGPVPYGGWKPLREIVRAHGLDMVGAAIEEGLLETTVVRQIVALCLRLRAYDEAQRVLESMVSASAGTENAASDDSTTRPLDFGKVAFASLNDFAIRTRRCAFLYRQTAAMLERDVLPLDWAGSKAMVDCWNGVIQSITQGDDHAQAASSLLRTTISKLYQDSRRGAFLNVHTLRLLARNGSRRPKLRSDISSQDLRSIGAGGVTITSASSTCLDFDSSPCSAISNVLTVLSAINVLNLSEPALAPHSLTTSRAPVLQDLTLENWKRLELGSCSMHPHEAEDQFCEWLGLSLVAADLASLGPRRSLAQSDHENLKALSAFAFSNESIDRAGLFLSTIAQCCARARSRGAFEFLRLMVSNLLIVASANIQDNAFRKICGKIALTTAFGFSEDTSQPEHLDWALEVELALNNVIVSPNKPAIEKTPARDSSHSRIGYRWEEGICEWIAKTPAVALQKARDSALLDFRDKSETAEMSGSSHEKKLLLLSEWSPSAMHQRSSNDTGRPAGGEVAALCVHINAKPSNYGEVHYKNIYERSQKRTYSLEPLQDVYIDNDFDELSTPDPSQEQPLVTTILGEIPNRSYGAKKRREHVSRNAQASKFSRIGKKLLAKHHKLDIDTMDLEDELSAL